jgi:hypothetical protein
MGGLRSNRRYCGYLSLAALALQIVLSFGHVHLGVARASFVATASGMAAPAPQPLPTQPADHIIGCCAICAALNLAANSFVPSAPQLAAPDRLATNRAFRSSCICLHRPAGDIISIARSAVCLIVFVGDRLPLRRPASAASSRPDA